VTFPREVWLAYAAIAGLTGLQAFLPEWRATQPPAGVTSAIAADFMTSGPIEMSRVSADEAYAMILVRNDSRQSARAEIQAVALDRHGNELTGLAAKELGPHAATAVRIQLTPSWKFDLRRDDRLPARGFVMLRVWPKDSQNVAPTVKVKELVVPQVLPSLAEQRITMIGVGAGLVVLLFGLLRASTTTMTPNAVIKGNPKWTPESWSTNLAIGGALLTGLLAIGGLPAQGYYASKASYTALAAFYAAMVALAPSVYGLLRVGSVSAHTALGLYGFAAAVTVWATVGQLGTAAQVSLELGIARVLSGSAATAAAALFWIVALLVFLHAIRAVHAYSTGGSPAAVPAGARQGAGPTDPPATAIADEWPLL